MTPEERAKQCFAESIGGGGFSVSVRIVASAIRAAVNEAYEECAKICDDVGYCSGEELGDMIRASKTP